MPDARQYDENDVAEMRPVDQAQHRRRRIWAIVIVLSVAVAMPSISAVRLWITHCPLSALTATDISLIRVTLYTGSEKSTNFTLEQKSVPSLLDALTPSAYDWNPADWQKLGRLDMELHDGSHCLVDLFDTYHESAAFRIDRRYYRGGSNEDLRSALGATTTPDHNGDDGGTRGKSESSRRG
jgi:hypothetical protein